MVDCRSRNAALAERGPHATEDIVTPEVAHGRYSTYGSDGLGTLAIARPTESGERPSCSALRIMMHLCTQGGMANGDESS